MGAVRGHVVLLLSGLLLFIVTACDGVVSPDRLQADVESRAVPQHDLAATELGPIGSIVAWGNDGQGQVSDTPDDNDIVAVSAGAFHNLALRENGTIVAWGRDGDFGRDEDGNWTIIPDGRVSDAPTGDGFVAISAGSWHNLALHENGSITAWGRDIEGTVDDTPVDNDFVAISAGHSLSLALHEDGTIAAWGDDHNAKVSDTPTGDGFVAVSAGPWQHNLALHEDGTIAAWGQDTDGKVSDTPTSGGFTAISVGSNHSLALHENGTIWAWGILTPGGSGVVTDAPTSGGFTTISAGSFHNLALHENGSLTSWGSDGNQSISDTPTDGGFLAISAGGFHSLAIQAVHIALAIEIMPGSINLNSRGVIPVAILSDSDFDALAEVDRESLTFGATGDENSLHLRGNGVPSCTEEDVNSNGLGDLVCRFHTQEAGFEEGDEVGVLRGQTTSGTDIEGSAEVLIIVPGGGHMARGPR